MCTNVIIDADMIGILNSGEMRILRSIPCLVQTRTGGIFLVAASVPSGDDLRGTSAEHLCRRPRDRRDPAGRAEDASPPCRRSRWGIDLDKRLDSLRTLATLYSSALASDMTMAEIQEEVNAVRSQRRRQASGSVVTPLRAWLPGRWLLRDIADRSATSACSRTANRWRPEGLFVVVDTRVVVDARTVFPDCGLPTTAVFLDVLVH